ncbi:uncharacterized protein LOC116163418 [Photinus pyralis]|uniref:Uncharacterized protein n=1 Tax=Photinus pyralis TaxID=7054 RepID=A0A1Y1KVX3_PHOPY|nr:uncharacterized protein LOC116163418 [Photinus pyralis]
MEGLNPPIGDNQEGNNEGKVMHFVRRFSAYWRGSDNTTASRASDSELSINDLDFAHQQERLKRKRKRQANTQEHLPRTLRKAAKIIGSTIEYGLANGLLIQNGNSFYWAYKDIDGERDGEDVKANVETLRTDLGETSELGCSKFPNSAGCSSIRAHSKLKKRHHHH